MNSLKNDRKTWNLEFGVNEARRVPSRAVPSEEAKVVADLSFFGTTNVFEIDKNSTDKNSQSDVIFYLLEYDNHQVKSSE